jgi:hypothetical protein
MHDIVVNLPKTRGGVGHLPAARLVSEGASRRHAKRKVTKDRYIEAFDLVAATEKLEANAECFAPDCTQSAANEL